MKRLTITALLSLALLLVACTSDGDGNGDAESDAPTPIETEAAQSTDEPFDATATVEDTAEPDDENNTGFVPSTIGSFSVDITGAYETSLPFVEYQYIPGRLGRYDLRFYGQARGQGVALTGDILLVLPWNIEPGTYAIFGEAGGVPNAEIGDLSRRTASLFVNLRPPDGSAIALDKPIEGELIITENNDGVISGEFTFTVGEEGDDERITVTGTLEAVGGSAAP